MSVFVVDSSVVVKWYVPEVLDGNAKRVRDGATLRHAPSFVEVELANILRKKVLRGETTQAEAEQIMAAFATHTLLSIHSTSPLVPAAFDIAVQTSRSVYDCLYVALAVQLGGKMVTADDRLVNALAGTPWAGYVIALSQIP